MTEPSCKKRVDPNTLKVCPSVFFLTIVTVVLLTPGTTTIIFCPIKSYVIQGVLNAVDETAFVFGNTSVIFPSLSYIIFAPLAFLVTKHPDSGSKNIFEVS